MVSSADLVGDRTVYPTEEKVGEDILQRWIMELLRPLLERWLGQRGSPSFVGADQFIYYEQFNPLRRIAPDIYVLPGVHPETHVASWKTWESGIVPSFALEIVSQDWEKDYIGAPERHAELGTEELLVFDPHAEERREGVCWQRFGRDRAGALLLSERTNRDRIHSPSLGCFLRAVGTGSRLRVRIATGPQGEALFPTAAEVERAAKEAERAAKEAERAAKEVALADAAELRRQLRELEKR